MSGQPSFAPAAMLGVVFALGSAISYGINIVSAREAALTGIAGPGIMFWRVLLMFVPLAAYIWWRGYPLAVPREDRLTLTLLATVSALMGVTYLSTVSFIPVTLAVVIFYTYPILIILFTPFVTGDRITLAQAGITALTFVGLIAVVGPAFETLDWRGIALGVAAAVFTATQFFTAAHLRRTPLLTKLFWLHVGMLPVSLIVSLVATGIPGPATLGLAPWAVVITVGCYIIGITLQMAALVRINAALAGLIFCLEPIVSTVASLFYLGERLTSVQIAGGIAVITAIVASVIAAKPNSN